MDFLIKTINVLMQDLTDAMNYPVIMGGKDGVQRVTGLRGGLDHIPYT